MDDRNAQVGWTDAQWNRISQAVIEEAQRARVAASFLPMYGPLPPSTEVVPSELLKDCGRVRDRGFLPDDPDPSLGPTSGQPGVEKRDARDALEAAITGVTAAAAQQAPVQTLADAIQRLIDLSDEGDALGVVAAATARVAEASGVIRLTEQQVREDELGSAMHLFRRAANRVARLEDWIVFNGQLRYQGA